MLKKLLKLGSLKAWTLHKEQLRKTHLLNYLFWECTLNCNFFCKHCGSSAGRKVFSDELTTEEIKKVFKEIAEDFNPKEIMLAITGGEPLLRKDLFSVMKYASDLGFPWGMVTNGFLVNEEAVRQMKLSGMKTVVVSIDGIGRFHDEFRQMPGAYQKAIEAVKLLAKANFLEDLQITTCIYPGNIDRLEEMYKVFLPIGITSWRVMNVEPIGRAEIDKKLMVNSQQLKRLLDFIKEKRRTAPIEITYGCSGFTGIEYEGEIRNRYFSCLAGIQVGSILHNGDIFVCPNVPRVKELIQGNIRKDRFSEIWNKKFRVFREKGRTKSKICQNCEFWDECLGGSYHLWDYKKKLQKMCHFLMLQETLP